MDWGKGDTGRGEAGEGCRGGAKVGAQRTGKGACREEWKGDLQGGGGRVRGSAEGTGRGSRPQKRWEGCGRSMEEEGQREGIEQGRGTLSGLLSAGIVPWVPTLGTAA